MRWNIIFIIRKAHDHGFFFETVKPVPKETLYDEEMTHIFYVII